jgi:RNA polymerase sigma-70 factor (ECF subfamily)
VTERPPAPVRVERLVGDLFRRASGRMVSSLARRLGAHRLDVAEEAVQEALARALQTWPYTGIPDQPESWLFRVAVNVALDVLRREIGARAKCGPLAEAEVLRLSGPEASNDVDDELAMMFMCCHPALAYAARLALTLKTVGGLSVGEIAAAFLTDAATVAQRIVRAKKQIREQRLPLDVPTADEMPQRLSSVLEAIYLLFNEGYAAHGGENVVRAELCAEAIRLARLLVAAPRCDLPLVRALLALMLFQAARLPARTSEAGELLLLDEQDRSRWNGALTAEAFGHFERSLAGEKTPFHVEAAIASVHAAAPGPDAVDWARVRALYDELMVLKPSPITALNRAVSIGLADGPAQGLEALQPLLHEPALANYHLLAAAMAALWAKAGDARRAAQFYREALRKPCSGPERRFLERQLARCEARAGVAFLP